MGHISTESLAEVCFSDKSQLLLRNSFTREAVGAVPGRIGLLLTTGVALSVAAAVVANPVIAPRPDLQIPAVQLSGTGDAMDMLNNDFLSAIGPTQSESSSNPFAVLKDLVASLAADATYLTKNAIVSAFFAGASAVTNPELTAASYPYVPGSPDIPGLAVPTGPAVVPSPVGTAGGAWPVSTDQLLAAAALPADLVPAASEVVSALMDDVHGLSESVVVAAAFAAGALLVTEGGQVVDTLRTLVDHGVEAALRDVLTAVGSGEPEKAIISAIRSVMVPQSATPSAVAPSAVPSSDVAIPSDEQATISAGVPSSPTPGAEAVGAERVQLRKSAVDSPAVPPRPAAKLIDADISLPAILKGGADPGARVRIPARPGPLNDALSQARNQVHGILHNAADAIGKAGDHAAKAASAPTGD